MSEFRTPYPDYDVLDKWDSPSWNDQTQRDAVRKRLEEVPERRFLSEEQWSLLEAIVERLIPQPDREEPVPIVPWIDDLLHCNHTPGIATPTCRRCARRGSGGSTAILERSAKSPWKAVRRSLHKTKWTSFLKTSRRTASKVAIGVSCRPADSSFTIF